MCVLAYECGHIHVQVKRKPYMAVVFHLIGDRISHTLLESLWGLAWLQDTDRVSTPIAVGVLGRRFNATTYAAAYAFTWVLGIQT